MQALFLCLSSCRCLFCVPEGRPLIIAGLSSCDVHTDLPANVRCPRSDADYGKMVSFLRRAWSYPIAFIGPKTTRKQACKPRHCLLYGLCFLKLPPEIPPKVFSDAVVLVMFVIFRLSLTSMLPVLFGCLTCHTSVLSQN